MLDLWQILINFLLVSKWIISVQCSNAPSSLVYMSLVLAHICCIFGLDFADAMVRGTGFAIILNVNYLYETEP